MKTAYFSRACNVKSSQVAPCLGEALGHVLVDDDDNPAARAALGRYRCRFWFRSYRDCSYVSPWSTCARSIALASKSANASTKSSGILADHGSWIMAAPRRLQNTCLEPSDASHVYTSGRDHSFAFQFRYTLGLDTISCGCERGDVQRAGGRRRPPFDRVLGGFGAWIDKEPFDGVPAVQKRGKVVVRYLGPRQESRSQATSVVTSDFIGGEGAVTRAASRLQIVAAHTRLAPRAGAARHFGGRVRAHPLCATRRCRRRTRGGSGAGTAAQAAAPLQPHEQPSR